MLNRDRKRKKSTFTLSSVTNDFINDLSTQRGINKSKLVDEAIKYYYQNINCPPIPPIPVEVINNDLPILPILPIKEVEVFDWTYEEEIKECPPNNKHWLDEIEFDQPVDTNSTVYTLQETEEAMQFKDFSDLMIQTEKYEIKGTQTVIKDQYKDQEDNKQPLNSMSSLIAKAQESGLSLKH